MKIKKFPQSCLLVSIADKKILVDPGCLKFDASFVPEWKTADVVLLTHRHPDHVNAEILQNLAAPIYAPREVAKFYPTLKIKKVKAGNAFHLGDATIVVTHAQHGFQPPMKTNGMECLEAVGYIISDGNQSIYITGDTICFNNDYTADILIAPATGNCVTMDAVGVGYFAKMVGAQKVYLVHNDNYPLAKDAESTLKSMDVKYEIMENGKEYTI